MEYITITEEKPQVVRIAYAGFDPTEQQFEAYLKELKALLVNRTEPMVLILDGSEAKYLSSKLRIRQGNWIKEHIGLIQHTCLKWNYVINSPLVKFIMKGIFLVQKPPVEYAVYTDVHAAVANATTLLPDPAVA